MKFLHQALQPSKNFSILSFKLKMFGPQAESGLYLDKDSG